jgi:hypothetical protein
MRERFGRVRVPLQDRTGRKRHRPRGDIPRARKVGRVEVGEPIGDYVRLRVSEEEPDLPPYALSECVMSVIERGVV